MEKFEENWLSKLWRPTDATGKFDGGQITIIGGSSLFHGAPILALRVVSRLASLVYFSTPVVDREIAEKVKSQLGSFIWVPRDELEDYVTKSDAVLIGPGMMRYYENGGGLVVDTDGRETRDLTRQLLLKFKQKRWVVDGGSLQMIAVTDLPSGSVITPNKKEYRMLFGTDLVGDLGDRIRQLEIEARRYGLIVVAKDVISIITDGDRTILVEGGNAGLIKGGTGDVLAGLTVGFLAKNELLLAAAAAQYLVKKAAERLATRVDWMYNADDLAEEVGHIYRDRL